MIPEGYAKIAETQMLGTGGVTVSAYYNDGEGKVFFLIVDPPSASKYTLGPLESRVLPTFLNVLEDVIEMRGKPVRYIG